MEWIIAAYAALSVGMATREVWVEAQDTEKNWLPRGERWHWWDYIWVWIFSLAIWPIQHWGTITHPLSIPERHRELKAERMAKRKQALAAKRLAECEEGWKLAAENLEAVKQQNREQRQSWQAEFDVLEAPHKAARQREQEQIEQQRRVEAARAALKELRDKGPVLFESGAKATFYEHGRQLFNLGAKLIYWELDDTEENALEYYLQSSRREEGLRRNWLGQRF